MKFIIFPIIEDDAAALLRYCLSTNLQDSNDWTEYQVTVIMR